MDLKPVIVNQNIEEINSWNDITETYTTDGNCK